MHYIIQCNHVVINFLVDVSLLRTLTCYYRIYVDVNVLFIQECFSNTCNLGVVLRHDIDTLFFTWIHVFMLYQVFEHLHLIKRKHIYNKFVLSVLFCNKFHIDWMVKNVHTTWFTSCLLLQDCSFPSSVDTVRYSSSPSTWQKIIGFFLFIQIVSGSFVNQDRDHLVFNFLS